MNLIGKLRTAALLVGTNTLARCGYVLRRVGDRSTITGVSFLHDAKVLLKHTPKPLLFDVGANWSNRVGFLRNVPVSANRLL